MPAAPAPSRRAITFRTKLAVTTVLVGLVPLVLASLLAYRNAHAALEAAVLARLETVRDERHRQVDAYFEAFQAEVRMLAASPGMQTGLPQLAAAVLRLPEELGWDGTDGGARVEEEAVRSLSRHYAGEVAPRIQAAGLADADAGAWMPTSRHGRAAQHLFLDANPHPIGAKHLLDRPSGAPTAYGDVHARLHPYVAKVVAEFGFAGFLLVDGATGTVVYNYGKTVDFGGDVREGVLAKTGMARVAREALEAQVDGAVFAADFEPYVPTFGQPAAFLACPIRTEGKTVGAIVVRVPIQRLDATLHAGATDDTSSESYLVGADHLMRTSSRFETTSTILRKRLDSQAVRESIAGRTGSEVADDYRGVESLVAYRPLEALGLRYGLVSKVDTAEAFAPLRELLWWMLGLGAVLGLAAVGVGVFLARSLARPIAEATSRLTTLAQGLLSTAQEQQAGAAESAAAVEETRQTFAGVLSAAQSLRTVGTEVLSNAEVGQRNAQTIGRRIRDLSANTAHITEILTIVKEIANRSDLLALNAALEGTKAGEAGRGFSLVATQMQRLAEEVMGSVKKIEALTQDISRASSGSVLAAEEAEKVSAQTTSSAQHIAAAVQQQQAGTEQVGVAMNEISTVAQNSVEAARRIVASSNDLLGLAEELRRTVGAKG